MHKFSSDYTTLIGIFLIGMGFILTIPIFENIDESAHFSRFIDKIHHNFSIKNDTTRTEERIENYSGPMPYSTGTPPFDNHLTYKKFFKKNDFGEYIDKYRNQGFSFEFNEGQPIRNDQYQHPPFYSIMMGYFLKPIDFASMHTQIIYLRIISFLISCIAIIIVLITFKKYHTSLKTTAFTLYPVLFPMFFIEFARIGTDCMCFLICSILFYVSSKYTFEDKKYFLYIGMLCGIGMLFKSFFIAILAGFMFYSTFFNNKKISFIKLLYLITPFIMIALPWLIFNKITNSHLSLGFGFNDLLTMSYDEIYQNFSIIGFLRGLIVPIVTFTWAGTWSLARVPVIMQIIFLIPLITLFSLVFLKLKTEKTKDNLFLMSIIIASVFYLALGAHALISQLSIGLGTTPGWYMHILFPWILYLLSYSTNHLNCLVKKIIFLQFFIVLFTTLISIWLHLCLFTGFATKNNQKYIEFLVPNFGLNNISEVLSNALILNHTILGLITLIIGYILICCIFYKQNIKN